MSNPGTSHPTAKGIINVSLVTRKPGHGERDMCEAETVKIQGLPAKCHKTLLMMIMNLNQHQHVATGESARYKKREVGGYAYDDDDEFGIPPDVTWKAG
jgi:hypothetical protein